MQAIGQSGPQGIVVECGAVQFNSIPFTGNVGQPLNVVFDDVGGQAQYQVHSITGVG